MNIPIYRLKDKVNNDISPPLEITIKTIIKKITANIKGQNKDTINIRTNVLILKLVIIISEKITGTEYIEVISHI
jgi:hypothetical protein